MADSDSDAQDEEDAEPIEKITLGKKRKAPYESPYVDSPLASKRMKKLPDGSEVVKE